MFRFIGEGNHSAAKDSLILPLRYPLKKADLYCKRQVFEYILLMLRI